MELQPSHRDVQVVHGSYHLVRSVFSNQIKSLLLSHHQSTSALVSEILMSVLQRVQKKQQTIYIWTDSAKKNCTGAFTVLQTVQKNNNNNLHMDRQCKKTTNNLHMDRQCKKTALGHLQCSRQCKKTTTIYILKDYKF